MMECIKPSRAAMRSKVFLFLIGSIFIYCQVHAAENIFIAELMVESNVTVEPQTVLSALNGTTLTLTDSQGAQQTVQILQSELVAECSYVGSDTVCNCGDGYIWSNEVCYNKSCCRATPCNQDVAIFTPICVAKVKVYINGSVILTSTMWDAIKTNSLVTNFESLNGFENLTVIGLRLENTTADFEAIVSVKFPTWKLQDIVNTLQTSFGATLLVDTLGMVNMVAPTTTVCYESTPVLSCTFEEATGSAGWNMSRPYERIELNTGKVVALNHSCATDIYKSCVKVTLHKVKGVWEGTYECGFTSGSIRHTAKAHMKVALLPDVITLKISPLTVDCSGGTEKRKVNVTATILNSTENFEVWSTYMDKENTLYNQSDGNNQLVYAFSIDVSCMKTNSPASVNVTFKNRVGQKKSAKVDIPVVYEGEPFCSEEVTNGQIWPKTPSGDTVINRTCEEGRVGYKSRTCKGTTWELVYSYCVKEELNNVVNAADNFLQGLGATQEVARDIFAGLKNSSMLESDSSDTMSDISASISAFDMMAQATRNVELQEDVFPDFVHATSNILNKTWSGVNDSTLHIMSSTYLQSVEGLVKNVRVNNSREVNSENMELKFCSSSNCNISVFDIGISLDETNGMMKTAGVKNLMNKLRNSYAQSVPTKVLVSVTLDNATSSSINITMSFPKEPMDRIYKPVCVFWNVTQGDWSGTGCAVRAGNGDQVFCNCNHLTSFAVLMAKNNIVDDALDLISKVGLGVSVCSLIIFLIIESVVWSAVVKSNLSHFRHTALVNIATFLLLADICFLASISPESLSDNWCFILTMCKHLFYLAMFSWMLCMSVMLVHQLIFVFNPLRKRVFMFLSSIAGYVCPIIIVGSSYVYCRYTEKDYYNRDTCWLVYEKLLEGSIHAFFLPMGTIILTNLFSMVVVIVTLVKTSVPDSSKTDDKETAKSILKVVVFLTPVFGITWIIGFAQLMLDEDDPLFKVAVYSFTILNSFQGLLILITGCIAEQKVREELIKIILAKSKGNSDSTKNLTSTMYTKDK